MIVDKFKGPGSTPSRRRFWDNLADTIESLSKVAGRNVTVQEFQGQGTIINVDRKSSPAAPTATGACCVGAVCSITTAADCATAGGTYQGDGTVCDPNPCGVDCSTCDDLPPIGMGPPTHINIVRTLSGSCGNITYTGTQTYDADLVFGIIGPVDGHFYCAHVIAANSGDVTPWSGHFTATCTLDSSTAEFDGNGVGGYLGRDTGTCAWFFKLDGAAFSGALGTCDSCGFLILLTGGGSPNSISPPPGTYIYSDSNSGVTLDTTVTVT